MTTALITGASGQTGSHLADLLVEKGYQVHCMIRRASTINTDRIDHLLEPEQKIMLHYGDLDDTNSIVRILMLIKPDMIFNIGSQSHVRVSFDIPLYTANVTGLGPLRILEALRSLEMKHVRMLQASSSECFGLSPPNQNEKTPMLPTSPYGASKVFAFNCMRIYRWGYHGFYANSICFNHTGPRRAETFVTKKIVRGACKIKLGTMDKLHLGNLEAKRDFGHAKDYARAQYMILTHSEPDDFVVATEEFFSIQEFLEKVFKRLNLNVDDHIVFEERLLRPTEVPALRGDATKIHDILGWKPQYTLNDIIEEMVSSVMEEEKKKLYFEQQERNKLAE